MASEPTGTQPGESGDVHLLDADPFEESSGHAPKRHARVTVKYNRKELQRRLDVEKWIDDRLDVLYSGQIPLNKIKHIFKLYECLQEEDMPEEVNIDDFIDLPDDVERVRKLQELLTKCNKDTETFVRELVEKLQGVHKEEELQSEGVEHPVIAHSHHRHEPYHFNKPHHFHQGQNQTL